MKKIITPALYIFTIIYLSISGGALAVENEKSPQSDDSTLGSQSMEERIIDGFSWRLNLIEFGIIRSPETDSILNYNNQQNINTYQAELNIRPDFDLNLTPLRLSAKPRWRLKYEKWTEGLQSDETETTDEFYVNEWLAQLMITDELFVSYGRENLQWGPSFLISPSNPFIKDNGRDNPKLEVSGLDYARVVWIPHYNWSASLIVNTDDGEHEFYNEFNQKYALKIDYTGYQKYCSMILSHEEFDGETLGVFAGWSVSDATQIYGEGSVRNDSVEDDNTDLDFLLGASYTFEMGPTFACEYYFNENGFTGPIYQAAPPYGKVNFDDVLIRKNYGLLQITDSKIANSFNYVIRWIQDLDDSSSRAIGILEYELGDLCKIFTIGDTMVGNTDDEFGSINKYSLYLGFEIIY